MTNTITKVKLSDIKPDLSNANRHTERGQAMLRDSISEHGFAEAGTLDKEGRVIGGNHRLEVSADILAADEAIVVKVDGKQPVFIQRDDIDLATPEGRRLAYALNRTAQVSIDFDPEQMAVDLVEGIDLGGIFYDDEISELLADVEGFGIDKDLDSEKVNFNSEYAILISCNDETEQNELLNRLIKLGIECQALIS